jgi:hypothetical protein
MVRVFDGQFPALTGPYNHLRAYQLLSAIGSNMNRDVKLQGNSFGGATGELWPCANRYTYIFTIATTLSTAVLITNATASQSI